MLFNETKLTGGFVIEIQKAEDERGFFGRAWCKRELEEHGLDANLAQCNVSHSRRKGTLRGMHYQDPPYAETKLVRCTAGAVFDVMVDLRPDSATFLQWTGTTLTPDNGRMMYVPKGFGHGFLTLADDCDVFYMATEFFAPDSYRGLRWNDPRLGIAWPGAVTVIHPRDAGWIDADSANFEPLRGMV